MTLNGKNALLQNNFTEPTRKSWIKTDHRKMYINEGICGYSRWLLGEGASNKINCIRVPASWLLIHGPSSLFWYQSKARTCMRLPISPYSVIVTLVLSCTVLEILQVFVLQSHPYSTLILRCSRCNRSPTFGSMWAGALSYIQPWNYFVNIPTYVITWFTVPERHGQTDLTDGQTDDILSHNRALRSIAR